MILEEEEEEEEEEEQQQQQQQQQQCSAVTIIIKTKIIIAIVIVDHEKPWNFRFYLCVRVLFFFLNLAGPDQTFRGNDSSLKLKLNPNLDFNPKLREA